MRLQASEVLAKARLGTDVVAEANAAAAKSSVPTLGKLVPLYLAARESELRAKSYVEAERYLMKTWKPLHDRAIDTITRRDIVAHLDTMQAKVAADRARTTLAALFGWAIDRSYLGEQPLQRHPFPGQKRRAHAHPVGGRAGGDLEGLPRRQLWAHRQA